MTFWPLLSWQEPKTWLSQHLYTLWDYPRIHERVSKTVPCCQRAHPLPRLNRLSRLHNLHNIEESFMMNLFSRMLLTENLKNYSDESDDTCMKLWSSNLMFCNYHMFQVLFQCHLSASHTMVSTGYWYWKQLPMSNFATNVFCRQIPTTSGVSTCVRCSRCWRCLVVVDIQHW